MPAEFDLLVEQLNFEGRIDDLSISQRDALLKSLRDSFRWGTPDQRRLAKAPPRLPAALRGAP